jgi:hypothetical protein
MNTIAEKMEVRFHVSRMAVAQQSRIAKKYPCDFLFHELDSWLCDVPFGGRKSSPRRATR